MSEHGPGIVLTRKLELPFVPGQSIRLCGTSIDACPDPLGFALEDLTWDIDREVFLAHTSLTTQDEPLAFIPDSIRSWLDLGWKLGSYHDTYGDEDDGGDVANDDGQDDNGEYERLDVLHTMPKNKRNREFNQFFKALIRVMGESYDNLDVAFAMDKLGRLVTEESPGPDESPISRRWREARNEFHSLGQDEQFEWMDTLAKYPTIERALGLPLSERLSRRAISDKNE